MKQPQIRRSGGNGRRSTYVVHNGLMYISGITTVALEEDITGQAQDILGQIERLMAANGTGKRNVLNAGITLKTMEDYGDFNAVWDAWVDDEFEPARSVVAAGLALPEYRVKISMIVALPG